MKYKFLWQQISINWQDFYYFYIDLTTETFIITERKMFKIFVFIFFYLFSGLDFKIYILHFKCVLVGRAHSFLLCQLYTFFIQSL